MPLLLQKFVTGLLAFLTIAITVPIWVFIIVGAWLFFDRHSAIRNSVNTAVKNLVAGEELAAANQQIKGKNELIRIQTNQAALAQERANRAESANSIFMEQLKTVTDQNEAINDELSELASKPVSNDCSVSGDLANRLRNK